MLMFLQDAGIGTSIDSFCDYLLKAYLLFGADRRLSVHISRCLFRCYAILVLGGDIDPAIQTDTPFFSVEKIWFHSGSNQHGQRVTCNNHLRLVNDIEGYGNDTVFQCT